MPESWPEGFGAMGGLSFEQAFQSEKELVSITLDGMSEATGIFKRWYDFCHSKVKQNGQTPETGDGKDKGGYKPG